MTFLPCDVTVIGIDEHTALVMDLGVGICGVMGLGGVTVLGKGEEQRFTAGQAFSMAEL